MPRSMKVSESHLETTKRGVNKSCMYCDTQEEKIFMASVLFLAFKTGKTGGLSHLID